ncbi:hypothetical protein HYC85_024097 [Camellia sinensis]|uniref:SF4 helicase domain-containing protein n=1 Tax=Camellia sinensis TaxID=4442 RepID=A0A7J7G9I6_CAMSI|nr:hypothetical protein HYC85_024097 [Camellia sinensis]
MLIPHRYPLHKLFTSNIFMASKPFLKFSPFTVLPTTPSSQTHLFHTKRFIFSTFPSKSISKIHPFSLKNNGFSSVSDANIHTPVSQLYGVTLEENGIDLAEMKVLRRKMEELGIDSNLCKPGQYNHLICPMCKGGDSGEKSLSLFITCKWEFSFVDLFSSKMWLERQYRVNQAFVVISESFPIVPILLQAYVNGNSTSGRIAHIPKVKQTRDITEKSLDLEPPCSELCAYFAERMISGETLRRNAVMQRRYGDQEKDTEKIFYGLDDIKDSNDIIIVEGEMDKLAMEEAGFRNCVSVPDGAPASVSKKELPSEEQDTKYQYLWNCKEYLEKASRIILATDGDLPGQALAEELARRLGRERCWRVKWPKKNDVDHFKDANEVLMYMGPTILKEVIESAELYPIKGLFNFRDYFDEIDAYYYRTLGYELGVSTGWRGLNEIYNVVPGELTIVTGVPNSGKSEWIDALLSNLNASVGWKFALCSMENKASSLCYTSVREHARKLLEKHIKKPFFDARYGESVERMSVDELEQGKKWLSDTFYLIRCENDCLPSINWVLGLAKAAVLRHGVNGLVIDPYNELDHQRPPSQTETEYVSQMLTKVKRFAQHHSCHVWFVAHPRQLHHWVGSPPNLYDISGSAHFINKCDNGIVIHRNRDPDAGPMDQVQVCVRKVRNKVAGTIGDAFLSYNRYGASCSCDVCDLLCGILITIVKFWMICGDILLWIYIFVFGCCGMLVRLGFLHGSKELLKLLCSDNKNMKTLKTPKKVNFFGFLTFS